MVRAVHDLGFMAGDVQVTGAKLEKPEHGIKASIDSVQLAVTQELPSGGNEFLDACISLSGLAMELFAPDRIWSNGFAQKTYWSFPSPEAALEASLLLAGDWHNDLGKEFGMTPSHQHLEYHFRSGSYEFNIGIQPVTFERVATARFNPDFRASPEERERIDRMNRRADRVKLGPAHALMMDLDLVEQEPPPSSLQKHFAQLQTIAKTAETKFHLK